MSVVNGFQAEFEDQLDYLSKTMATSISRQSEQLHCVENCCHSFLDLLEKAAAFLVFGRNYFIRTQPWCSTFHC
nr:kinesin-like protein KIN-5C isoform X2 [Ipomoea trifida]GLL37301.1 kinesin-like protein KIN-5C isoform X2 [Ipomoea trifida]